MRGLGNAQICPNPTATSNIMASSCGCNSNVECGKLYGDRPGTGEGESGTRSFTNNIRVCLNYCDLYTGCVAWDYDSTAQLCRVFTSTPFSGGVVLGGDFVRGAVGREGKGACMAVSTGACIDAAPPISFAGFGDAKGKDEF